MNSGVFTNLHEIIMPAIAELMNRKMIVTCIDFSLPVPIRRQILLSGTVIPDMYPPQYPDRLPEFLCLPSRDPDDGQFYDDSERLGANRICALAFQTANPAAAAAFAVTDYDWAYALGLVPAAAAVVPAAPAAPLLVAAPAAPLLVAVPSAAAASSSSSPSSPASSSPSSPPNKNPGGGKRLNKTKKIYRKNKKTRKHYRKKTHKHYRKKTRKHYRKK